MTRWDNSHQMAVQDHGPDLPTPFERHYDSMLRATVKLLNTTLKVKVSLSYSGAGGRAIYRLAKLQADTYFRPS